MVLTRLRCFIKCERETRRGKKLADQDRIDFPDIPDIDSFIIIHQGEQ